MLKNYPDVHLRPERGGRFFQARLDSQNVQSSDLRKELKEKYSLSANQINSVEAVLENKFITAVRTCHYHPKKHQKEYVEIKR